MKLFLTILIFSLIISETSYSQQYTFSSYSINEGLSQSVVNCIFQDSKGFVWIGTQNGLNRFNGETFNVFTTNPADSLSISNNWIYAITEDLNGNLWIGTKDGLNKYLPAQNRFEQISWQTDFLYDVTHYCYDVVCLKSGNIFINTPPVVSIYSPENNSISHFQSTLEYDGAVKDVKIPVLEDSDGKIWIGSTNGLAAFSVNTEKFSYYTFADNKDNVIEQVNITALFKDKKGTLWAGTTNGLYHYESTANRFLKARFTTDIPQEIPLEDRCIRTILEDKKGNLIIGTEGGGLFAVTIQSGNRAKIQNYTTENSDIGHNIVQSLFIDRSDNLWIGTLSGISKTDLKPKKFALYRKSNSPHSVDLMGNVIASLYKNNDGMIWVGNWGQGLNLLNRNTSEVEHFSTQHTGNHKLTNDFVHVIFKDSENRIWLGTRNGILIYDKPQNRFIPWYEYFKNPALPAFSNVRINKIIQDKTLNYWIGTQNGLYKIDLQQSDVEVFQNELAGNHHLSANLVYCLLEDADGLIWIATVNGLDVYNPGDKKIHHFRKQKDELSDNLIISLCEDSKGRIWIGTSTYLNVFSKPDSSFFWYTPEHGLPNNNIFEIIKDQNNTMWVATGKGLCRFDEQQNTFHTFTPDDGLQSLEFNLRAACLCPDGEILIGGMNGFNSYYPDSIFKNPYIPKLVFTSFSKTKGSAREIIPVAEKDEVALNFNLSSFTIEFAALEFTNPKKNQFAYQMIGISDEWVEIGNRRFVPFSGLQPGKYTFSVKGSNNDGIWNENKISLGIVVLPPWWRSIYAYIAYILLVFLLIFTYIKLRLRKLKHDKKILQQKVEERTLQIEEQNRLIVAQIQELKELNLTKDKLFSIIGHDLGNQFNTILGFLEVLISDLKSMDPGKAQYHLTNVYNASKHACDLLENLLTWARMQTNLIEYNPQLFNVNAKITETLGLFQGASAKKNIKINTILTEELFIYADVNMFFTVLRNLVANAIKFTQENGTVSISAKRHNNSCEISVNDTGIGIPAENMRKIFSIDSKHKTPGTHGEKGTGLGLVLCREFVEKQHGKIWVESEMGKGSRFSFTLPLKKET